MKIAKLLLYPFALIYGFVMRFRNILFDFGVFKSKSYSTPIISLGNISMGGAGKTPHTEYLLRILGKNFKVATLSRGYGRLTKGFRYVTGNENASEVGDEPLMLKNKFLTRVVAVCENRNKGISRIILDNPETNAIVLDDAYQHRSVNPGINILLTDYSNIYTTDIMFPTGYLREPKSASTRADIIVVTKTPSLFSPLDRRVMKAKLKTKPYQKVFFSYYEYKNLVPVFENNLFKTLKIDEYLDKSASVLLVTGIARPRNLYFYIKDRVKNVQHMSFRDHHHFQLSECEQIKLNFKKLQGDKKMILTTEKDAIRMRIDSIQELLSDLPIYFLPIKVEFHDKDKEEFDTIIKDYVRRNQAKS